jgi:hypothetical protein
MMTFGELLRANKEAIVQRWFNDILATYPEDSALVFGREQDPFANPVGHSLRVGTHGIVEALLDGTDTAKVRDYLHGIIKIRAVQEFSASEIVGFVFPLKQAIRTVLSRAATDTRFYAEWAELEERIDRMALEAFDVFVECREKIHELRVKEMKRSIPWVVEKMNQRRCDRERERSST